MMRQQICDAIGYSIVELGGARHVFAAAEPRNGATLADQCGDALEQIQRLAEDEGVAGSIVHQTVFLRDPADIEACRRLVRQCYGDRLPATSYVPQPPCSGKLVAIEAMGLGAAGTADVAIQRLSDQLVVTRHDGVAWIHLAGVVPDASAGGVYDQSLAGFREMQQRLTWAAFAYEQVVRTWLYLGDIVGPEGQTQRYKELNRARSDFYDTITFAAERFACPCRPKAYPASTGIGAEGRGIVMSCLAIDSDQPDTVVKPLENPKQTAACDYGQQYGIRSPMFSRAMAVAAGECVATFVSGTASITGEDTRHLDDVAAQTEQTLANIEALISEENLEQHGLPGCGASLDQLALVRVYVKDPADYAKTRAVCERLLGDRPTLYTVADVCRPELLVEIEGMAFTRRG
jgi:enamine deaminase RidA (YjgF/YER057c/UK114 family)